MRTKRMNKTSRQARLLVLMMLILSMFSCSREKVTEQIQLGYRSVNLLDSDGLHFKDLNKNGKLDKYEDWRLSDEARSADLLAKMTLEEKAGFMLISTTRMENDWAFEAPKNELPLGSGFNEEDLVMDTNMFTRRKLDYPNMSVAGTSKAVKKHHQRHFILRANPSAQTIAEWSNRLQELCEGEALGIPAIVASNPRNHITMDASKGLSMGKTVFTQWPGELGLAAMRDFELSREFAETARKEWTAVGLRKGYMYMADLATEPRWQRIEGTFGEDADLAAKMIREIVLGFQGETLGSASVALTTKHFPGGGATEGGQDPHFEWGKREVFEGGMLENNLIPFKAAIEAGTSAIMPYYSFPVNTKYPQLAYAFNKPVLQDLLRGELGFRGIINSDTGPIDMMPWGVETLSQHERYKMAIEAGVNIFSGTADPTILIETLRANPELMPMVDESVLLLLMEKFKLGLFENPYVDAAKANAETGRKEYREKAALAMRKSIVLLRNNTHQGGKKLPLQEKTKVYFEKHSKQQAQLITQFDSGNSQIELVSSPEEADINLLWLIPSPRSLFESDGSPLFLSLSKNGIDTQYINQQISKKPTVLIINYTNPWVIDEIYKEDHPNIVAVLATFGTSNDALLDVVSGHFNPSGKMPFSTPVSEIAAQNQQADVPGYLEGPGYALFNFNEGLSY